MKTALGNPALATLTSFPRKQKLLTFATAMHARSHLATAVATDNQDPYQELQLLTVKINDSLTLCKDNTLRNCNTYLKTRGPNPIKVNLTVDHHLLIVL